MAENTAVNSQITDSVTQSNVKVLAEAPAIAMGAIYQSTAQALGLAAQNAVANQQAVNELAISALGLTIRSLLGGEPPSGAKS